MRSSLTEADLSPSQQGKANKSSRENSIELTSEDTLNRLSRLDDSSGGSGSLSSSSRKPSHIKSGSRAKTTGGAHAHMEKMSQSMNFLNLDRRSMITTPTYKTVGGDNPREALMKLRIKRLSKKPTPTTATERLYQSDSALLGGNQNHSQKANARDAVWFKSSYPTRHTLEKLEEAEHEFDESTSRLHDDGGEHDPYGDMPELDDFNTSSTDLWLHGNQSAPGDFRRRPNAAYMNDDDKDDNEDMEDITEGEQESGDRVGDDMRGGAAGRSGNKGNRGEMQDESIQIV